MNKFVFNMAAGSFFITALAGYILEYSLTTILIKSFGIYAGILFLGSLAGKVFSASEKKGKEIVETAVSGDNEKFIPKEKDVSSGGLNMLNKEAEGNPKKFAEAIRRMMK